MSKQDYEYEKARKQAKKQAVAFRRKRQEKRDQWQPEKE